LSLLSSSELAVVDDELDPPDVFWPKAAALTAKAAQTRTTGLRIGPKNLSTLLITYLRFLWGGHGSLDEARTTRLLNLYAVFCGDPLIEPDHTIFSLTDREESGEWRNPHLQMTLKGPIEFHAAAIGEQYGQRPKRPALLLEPRFALEDYFFLSATISNV
jgi:hypothetical protein